MPSSNLHLMLPIDSFTFVYLTRQLATPRLPVGISEMANWFGPEEWGEVQSRNQSLGSTSKLDSLSFHL